jgi:hypothetical protein
MKKKYNLTFWQRLSLIPLWIYWLGYESPTKKTWHEVKKGMEKHKCNFVRVRSGLYDGRILYHYKECDHEGCNVVEIIDEHE